VLSFHVIFQCKRYKDTVSSAVVRDFRGAMVGRADKGLLITTGTFTRDARAEAQRDGAPPLDLIDGEELVHKLKDLRLGINVTPRLVEDIAVNKQWLETL
jgi:restriction system protein